MRDVRMTFKERNRVRLAKKAEAENKMDCYEKGTHSKIGDFFIGFGIFVLPLFVPFIGIIISAILSIVLYNKYFKGRRFVKYGMISAAAVAIFWILFVFVALWGMYSMF